MAKEKKQKPSGCGLTKPDKGSKSQVFHVSATCPAGQKLVKDVANYVKKDLGLK